MQLHRYQTRSWLSDTRLLGETYRHGLPDQERIQAKAGLAMSERDHRFGAAEDRMVTLEVERYNSLGVLVELDRMADL